MIGHDWMQDPEGSLEKNGEESGEVKVPPDLLQILLEGAHGRHHVLNRRFRAWNAPGINILSHFDHVLTEMKAQRTCSGIE
jgi:hypothetical protein